jgi:hypothetical protein
VSVLVLPPLDISPYGEIVHVSDDLICLLDTAARTNLHWRIELHQIKGASGSEDLPYA